MTLRRGAKGAEVPFRLRIEIARMLDSLGVDVIEVPSVRDEGEDHFLVRSIASTVRDAVVAVPVEILDPASPARCWEALREARKARLQVPAPVSTVQMEYACHCKAPAMLARIAETVEACASFCGDVEFVAGDATRADREFLRQAIETAVKAGATTVTLADSAGTLLPDETGELVASVKAALPAGVRLGIVCGAQLRLPDACALQAVRCGADEVKTSAFGDHGASLVNFPTVLQARGESLDIATRIRMTALQQGVERICGMCEDCVGKSPTAVPAGPEKYDAPETLDEAELPSTYTLESFLTNSGNVITATCHIRLRKAGELLEHVCVGDGPVDAAFLAIEKAIGVHYELDDFQIRSITEGREAIGETTVRLRHDGRVFSGRGQSTDIVASSILAYLSAVNKIAYGEDRP